MPSARTWVKAITAGAVLCIGGPNLVWYVTPTEEEIFKRYSPELQKRALETRAQRDQEFEDYVVLLKEASKSDKHIWIALKEIEQKRSAERAVRLREEQDTRLAEAERKRAEMRSSVQ